ncbi:hypothetical protein HK101_000435 [Irineochytrium annulatum]|nr:hypothetical protein HK101_000435 [Irineochytrium annulatum]
MLNWATAAASSAAGVVRKDSEARSEGGYASHPRSHRNSVIYPMGMGLLSSAAGGASSGNGAGNGGDKHSPSTESREAAGRSRHHQHLNGGSDGRTVRVKVATSKRCMNVVLNGDATVSDFLDVVSAKIFRGFPVGSVVFNPQPVVAVMSRDGFFYDEDDLIRQAFDPDADLLALTNEELRTVLRSQSDPFFSRLASAPPEPSQYPRGFPAPLRNEPQQVNYSSRSSVAGSTVGDLIGAGGAGVNGNGVGRDEGSLSSMDDAPPGPGVGPGGGFRSRAMSIAANGTLSTGAVVKRKPTVFVSFSQLNSARMAGSERAVGSCDPHSIYKGLKEAGFNVFIDESEREAGEPLSEELVDMMLKATHFVTCISKEYAESIMCETEFKFSRLKKRVIVLVGGDSLDFFSNSAVGFMCGGGDVTHIDFRDTSKHSSSMTSLVKALEAPSTGPSNGVVVPSLVSSPFSNPDDPTSPTAAVAPLLPRRGRIYIAYCWDNSLSAVRSLGQLAGAGVGVCDPRTVAQRLKLAGFEVWVDVRRRDVRRLMEHGFDPESCSDQTSDSGDEEGEDGAMGADDDEMADALTLGMDQSDCMIAFISDEFASSPLLTREFHFAHNVLRLPLVPVVVGMGSGATWRAGPVGESVRGYMSLDATSSDVDLESLLRLIYKVMGASPPPEGPRRPPVEEVNQEEEDVASTKVPEEIESAKVPEDEPETPAMIFDAVIVLATVGYAGAACIKTSPVAYSASAPAVGYSAPAPVVGYSAPAPASTPVGYTTPSSPIVYTSATVAGSTVKPSSASTTTSKTTTTSATATSTALVKNPTDFSQKGLDFLIIGDCKYERVSLATILHFDALVRSGGNQADITDMQNTANYMDKWAKDKKSDVVMVLGDNFYQGGNFSYEGVQSVDDPKYKVLWEDVYSDYLTSIPWWFILGNHDWYLNTSNTVELTYAQSNARWYEPDYFYTQRISLPNGAHASFIFIETDLFQYGYPGKKSMSLNFVRAGWTAAAHTVEKQLAYIDAELEKANKDEFVFVMAHHPMFTCGSDVTGGVNMTQLGALVEKWKPTAYMNGHHHTLAYYVDNAGVMQVGIGATGNIDGACAPLYNVTGGGEVANTYGFGHAHLDDKAFKIQWVTETGEVVFDEKATPRTPVVGVKSDNTWLPPAGDVSISWQGKA